ncbi:MAG TPA: TonB-dependent receptor [Ideonella sp.]|uniref:TonB-dependent receptor n=1 Tax=Ideonella sp. TaxID=1929293 RepID=UPI002E32092B|nr:TonB-dependent receptor [Ideonella sp.]HEX5687300.1 TonB-dependent receptor [Ideonella sp.]
MISKKHVVTALVPVAVLSGAGVMAQDKPVADAPPASSAVEQITVTATKRLTLVQDTPLAVSAFSAKDLEKAQVKDLSTMQALVPNLSVEQHGDSGGVHVFLRGVGSTNHTELGDPAVAFHVDGVYSPRPQGATVLMYDLASVEVARGPQGTLFGRNATAGSVNLVTAKPKFGDSSGSFGVVVGDRNHIGIQAAMNVPLAETAALRIAAISDRQDGWVEYQERSYVQPGARKYGATDQQGIRTTLLWDITENLRTTTALEYYRDQGTGNVSLMQTPREGQKWNSALIDTPGALDQDNTTFRTRIDWAITPAIELSYIGSISSMSRTNASDNDAGVSPGFKQEHRTEWSRFDNNTHELNLKSTDDGAFQWIAGLFSINEDNRIRFDIDISTSPVIGTTGPIIVNPVADTDTAWAMSFIQPQRTLSSQAVFGQGTFKFNKEWAITAGARHTSEKKEDVGGRNWVCPQFGATVGSGGHLIGPGGPVNRETCNSDYDDVLPAPDYGTWPGGGHNDGKTEDTANTYLGRVEFKPSKDLLAYGTVSTGFKSGGLSDGGRRHKPEFLTNYELGLKTELFDRSLAINVAAFMMKYKDMQVSSIEYTGDDGTGGRQQQLVTSNAAKATISGVEVEWSWRLTKADRFSGNLSFLDAKYDDFLTCDSALLNCGEEDNAQNLKGEQMPHAPKFSTTFAYEHDFTMPGGGLVVPRAQVHYQTRTKLGPFGDISPNASAAARATPDARFQDAYATVDLSLRYEEPKGRWFIEGFVVNASDEHVKTDASWVNGTAWTSFYNPPRTYGAKMGYRF